MEIQAVSCGHLRPSELQDELAPDWTADDLAKRLDDFPMGGDMKEALVRAKDEGINALTAKAKFRQRDGEESRASGGQINWTEDA